MGVLVVDADRGSDLFTSFGDTPEAVDRDVFLTNFMIYWFTGTAALIQASRPAGESDSP
jgi:hypothetical protein